MCFQFSMLNIYDPYGCHSKGTAIMQWAACFSSAAYLLALLLFLYLVLRPFPETSGEGKWGEEVSLGGERARIFWSRNRRKRLSGGFSSGGEIVLWRTLCFWSTKGWWGVSRESGISRGLHYLYVSFYSVSPRMCVGWIFLQILENCNSLGFLGFLLFGDFAKCFARSSRLQVCVLILI